MRVLLAGWFSFDEVIATVNVSVVEQSARGLFDRVWERDAPGLACPDLAVEGPEPQVPVVAVAFTPVQAEYGERSEAERVRGAIEEWLADRALPWFELDMPLREAARPPSGAGGGAGPPSRRRGEHAAARAGARSRARPPGRRLRPDRRGRQGHQPGRGAGLAARRPRRGAHRPRLDAALERCLSGALAERLRTAGSGAGNARARAWFEEQLAG